MCLFQEHRQPPYIPILGVLLPVAAPGHSHNPGAVEHGDVHVAIELHLSRRWAPFPKGIRGGTACFCDYWFPPAGSVRPKS